jgi:hemoglobin-like flavoprotein
MAMNLRDTAVLALETAAPDRAAIVPDLTLTDTEIDLVRRTFDLVLPLAGVAADLFYDRLFYLAPSVRRMFPQDMRGEKRSFIVMMATTVQNLDNPEALLPLAKALGARHARYGVTAGHYEVVAEVLIWTLERCLASDFTAAVERAWRRAFGLLAAGMREGARDAAMLQTAQ